MSTDNLKPDISSYFSQGNKPNPNQTPSISTTSTPSSQTTQQSQPMADISSYFSKKPIPATLDGIGGATFNSTISKQQPLSTVRPPFTQNTSNQLINLTSPMHGSTTTPDSIQHNPPLAHTNINLTNPLHNTLQTQPLTDISHSANFLQQQQQSQQNTPLTTTPQPPAHPMESFFRYSQVLQLSVQSLQSLTSHSFTLIQALLMFKHEICQFVFPSSFRDTHHPHDVPHLTVSKSPTLFQRLISQPIKSLFNLAIGLIDVIIRILTCNLISIRAQSSSSHHINKHIGYPYNQLNQQNISQQTQNTSFNSLLPQKKGPLTPNMTHHFPQPRVSSTSTLSSHKSLIYLVVTSLVIIGFVKYAPILSSKLETYYHLPNPLTSPQLTSSSLQSTQSTQSPISMIILPQTNPQLHHPSINQLATPSLFDILDSDPTVYLSPTQKLNCMHKTGHINPSLYEFYTAHPSISIPQALIDKFDPSLHYFAHTTPLSSISSTPTPPTPISQQISPAANSSSANSSPSPFTVTHASSFLSQSPRPLPSLFDHVDTTSFTNELPIQQYSQTHAHTHTQAQSELTNNSHENKFIINSSTNEVQFFVNDSSNNTTDEQVQYLVDQRTGRIKVRKNVNWGK